MNLTKLFEVQKVLKERIGYNGEDRFNKLVLALLVEIGECANEWRGFKFWSKDQKPRTEKLLEEYVDGLHFVLEIGLEHGYDKEISGLALDIMNFSTIEQQFTMLFRTDWEYCEIGEGGYYHEGLELYIGLGEMLGFTWEQIEQAYMDKNKVNHQRLDSGY